MPVLQEKVDNNMACAHCRSADHYKPTCESYLAWHRALVDRNLIPVEYRAENVVDIGLYRTVSRDEQNAFQDAVRWHAQRDNVLQACLEAWPNANLMPAGHYLNGLAGNSAECDSAEYIDRLLHIHLGYRWPMPWVTLMFDVIVSSMKGELA